MLLHSVVRACILPALVVLGLASETSAQSNRRVPAEFEPQEAMWLQWPGPFEQVYTPAFAEISNVVAQYQPLNILHDTIQIKNQARNAILAAGGDPDHPNITYHHIANDNAWMRDNGPVYVVQDGEMRIQDWEFDAWGGAFGTLPYANDNAVPVELGNVLDMPVDHVPIVHERGNLEFNGVDTVMLNWNVIGNPNRGNGYANKAEAEVDLKNWFGVTNVVWADGPISGDLTGGHIDSFARFIDADTAVVANCTVNGSCQPGDSDDQVYDATAADLQAAGFEVIRMDFEAEITYQGFSFDADYMNWGVGNGWVILVGFDNPTTDNAAKALLESWYPDRDVYVIEMLDSWIAGGGVHCHTNDQPAAIRLGDFDGDGGFDGVDVDALVVEIVSGMNTTRFDISGDGVVDQNDLEHWLAVAGQENLDSGNPYLYGDATLDGTVDGTDFIEWNANKFTGTAAWTAGDFNADGAVDGQDFILWNVNKFSSSGGANTVPEPAAAWLSLAGLSLMVAMRVRR